MKNTEKTKDQRLDESDKKYRGLYNSIRDSILIADTHRNIIDCNPAFISLFGYSFDEIMGKQTVYLYENEDEFKDLGKALKEHFGENPFIKTVNYKKKSGEIFPGETNVFYLKDEQGEVNGFIGLIRDITERIKADQALKASEEKYHLLYENTPLSYQSLNADGTLKNVNPAWLSNLGYEYNEVIGKYFGDFLHPDSIAHFKKNFPAFKKRGYVQGVQFKIRHKNGHYLDISFNGRIGYLPDGNFKQTYCVFEDITERIITEQQAKKAKEALLISEEKFRSVFEYSPLGKSITHINGKLEINRAFSDILGYSIEELKAKNWDEITHPDDIQKSADIVQSMLEGKVSSERFEKRYIHKKGNIVWTDVVTALKHNKEGKPDYFITSIQDITERKLAEEKLQLTQTSVDNLPDAVYWMGPDAKLIYVNEAASKALGYSNEELISMFAYNFSPEMTKEMWPVHWAELKEKNSIIFQTIHQRKDGSTFPVEITANFLQFGDKEINCAIVKDITERKQAEDKLKEAKKQLSSIYDSVNDIIYYLSVEPNETYKFISVNKSFLRVTGLKREQIEGLPVDKVIPEPSLTMVKGNYKKAIEEKKTIEWEEVSVYPAGKKTAIVNIVPVFDENDRCKNLIGSVHDITELKQAEEELNKQHQQLEELVKERTSELEAKNKKLDDAMKVFVGRELTIKNLQDRIRALEGK